MSASRTRWPSLLAALALVTMAVSAFAGAPNPSGPGVEVVAVDAAQTMIVGLGGSMWALHRVTEGKPAPNATVDLTFFHLNGSEGTVYHLHRPTLDDPIRVEDAPLLNATATASPSGGSNVTFPSLLLDRPGRWVLLREDRNEAVSLGVTLPPLVTVQNAKATAGLTTVTRIRVHDATDVGTLTLRLSFDPSVAEVVSVVSELTRFDHVVGPGVVNMSFVSGDVPGRSGSFDYVAITLRAIGAVGTSTPLDLTAVEAAHSNGTRTPLRLANGTFVIGVNGDANNDGVVDARDVQMILDHVLGRLVGWNPPLATTDLDRDGQVTAVDAMFIQQHLSGNRRNL